MHGPSTKPVVGDFAKCQMASAIKAGIDRRLVIAVFCRNENSRNVLFTKIWSKFLAVQTRGSSIENFHLRRARFWWKIDLRRFNIEFAHNLKSAVDETRILKDFFLHSAKGSIRLNKLRDKESLAQVVLYKSSFACSRKNTATTKTKWEKPWKDFYFVRICFAARDHFVFVLCLTIFWEASLACQRHWYCGRRL